MITISQQQINQACRSRSLKLIDEVLLVVESELMLYTQRNAEIREQGQKPSSTQIHEVRMLEYNRDRLNKRIEILGKRILENQKKKENEQAIIKVAMAMAHSKMPMHHAIQQAQVTTKTVIDPNAAIDTGDPHVDSVMNNLRIAYLTSKEKDFELIAIEAEQARLKREADLLASLANPEEPEIREPTKKEKHLAKITARDTASVMDVFSGDAGGEL